MKKLLSALFVAVFVVFAGNQIVAQSIPGLPAKPITDVAKAVTDLTKGIGTAVGGVTEPQKKSIGTELTTLLNGLNKDVIPKQLTNAAGALTSFNKLKEKFNSSMSTILGAAKLAKLVGGNTNGATGAILSMLAK